MPLSTLITSASAFAIKKNRLIDTIHETSGCFGPKGKWGSRDTETGVCRLALSDEDKGVRDWFVAELKSLGCTVKIDNLGNIFGVFPGKNEGKPIGIGSHLDTQPTGGRYDGILGVLSGLEVLRTMKENGFVPNYPICVVDWMNEEGARFPMSMMSSSVWAGAADLEEVYKMESVTDKVPVSVREELERIGYLGDIPCSYEANPLEAHFELHIEQGPILEEQNKKIGRVQGIQALRWIEITMNGKAQHTGTTPLRSRSDALLASSQVVVRGNEIAKKYGGLFSCGILEIEPAVVNVIPQKVRFVIDIRHQLDETLDVMYRELSESLQKIASSCGMRLSFSLKELVNQRAIHFDETCMKCITESSNELFGENQSIPIVSGAGHDSGLTAIRIPTAMIFIPSQDGVSHNFEEYSTPEQVDEGFRVLLGAVLKYDALRSK
ncbi:amidase [Metschnikowia bicuspidata var. bicuspidata NRRL YB-4993]|uniref:Amidase n=1 Tax=Metschnikowia bicuspidata var. bicuspidata NRRL YB-4993 TaxID=869754 RepID=A0A1A0HA45_9ASCO|nr:amidase [Metschnikowia bicuspidata var. bicuspidata NRRL YB-4993]OBA20886.1 amidase [Metschnikowia bicuspidata var. bicuspidata NRRL YB-4993]